MIEGGRQIQEGTLLEYADGSTWRAKYKHRSQRGATKWELHRYDRPDPSPRYLVLGPELTKGVTVVGHDSGDPAAKQQGEVGVFISKDANVEFISAKCVDVVISPKSVELASCCSEYEAGYACDCACHGPAPALSAPPELDARQLHARAVEAALVAHPSVNAAAFRTAEASLWELVPGETPMLLGAFFVLERARSCALGYPDPPFGQGAKVVERYAAACARSTSKPTGPWTARRRR